AGVVASSARFRGPAFPAPTDPHPDDFPNSAVFTVTGTGAFYASALADGEVGISGLARSGDAYALFPGHDVGGVPCAEVMVASHLDDGGTSYTLDTGLCGDTTTAFATRSVDPIGMAMGLAQHGTSTEYVVLIGDQAASCSADGFPACAPAKTWSTWDFNRDLHALTASDGGTVWALAGMGNDGRVDLFDSGLDNIIPDGGFAFATSGPSIVRSPTELVCVRLTPGAFIQIQGIDFDGDFTSTFALLDIGDADPDYFKLTATLIGPDLVRAAWVGSDGLGHYSDIDLHDSGNQAWTPVKTVCGGAVDFIAPMNAGRMLTIQAGAARLRKIP
ncbi:MAG: hypothetical protein JST92_27170, partial [Deltaproteobacteria bacterium]|nr:hypothetical protein [Deltaproteobacteria bacterium]